MPDLAVVKQAAAAVIDHISEDLRAISLSIHGNPELGFEERHTHRVLTEFLEN